KDLPNTGIGALRNFSTDTYFFELNVSGSVGSENISRLFSSASSGALLPATSNLETSSWCIRILPLSHGPLHGSLMSLQDKMVQFEWYISRPQVELSLVQQ
ncbi:hypothetical protein J6590_096578, partial [Homalodisca vitripennis]